MAPEAQVERLNKQFFLGAVGRRPAFDLHLVVWDGPEAAELVGMPLGTLKSVVARAKSKCRAMWSGDTQ